MEHIAAAIQLDIRHIKGRENVIADTLSRAGHPTAD